jgi:hypothetical protein
MNTDGQSHKLLEKNRQYFLRTRLVLKLTDRCCLITEDGSHTTSAPTMKKVVLLQKKVSSMMDQ